ncbi:UDP-N-acetylglucosamine 2-epimerase [Candidatus Methanoperedens nitroreducens]|uniref:UDP-N-acetylglucosamine 2-epimerase n=1 Tax=Candidatus Methanoperedens nitratireducens TaxID=1392998 RepID=A0A062V8S7_9EURY|nr:UDP-N-acetylglucosamine 2-epimerase (non-hydrolyzing) [Candidatus Methanoperedens nitroreducens]KCZ72169.1 UDP-N-acetylglucosamine 2-epimerase [Candidatus Methanoperedens nitroreducens]MDJ1421853.1 UDP-N-acetylglucosamine 2-epimerase (non-hydrolyzing) [Candidatus Methanoperedens sp.]
MKILTILGTRPEIIRLSRIIPKLDHLCNHVLVHTGQNYDRTLNELFFEELDLRLPDHILECKSKSTMEQIGKILVECERVIQQEKPDRLLVLGDTNSALSAIVAKRSGIPVYHMEAGNRCYDDRVPEEVNRRIIDHSSDILLPYTERSRANLLREGIQGERIYVTGNPIKEVLDYYTSQIDASNALKNLGVEANNYFLITLHRAENVDIKERLIKFIEAFHKLHEIYNLPVICSLHPRTRSQLDKRSLILDGEGVQVIEPFGLFDFINLEKHAKCVLSDSGTVQEECCIFRVPAVTLRDATERPETVEVGSNMLSGAEPGSILSCVKTVLNQTCDWMPPHEYLERDVSNTVVKIVLGYKWR